MIHTWNENTTTSCDRHLFLLIAATIQPPNEAYQFITSMQSKDTGKGKKQAKIQ